MNMHFRAKFSHLWICNRWSAAQFVLAAALFLPAALLAAPAHDDAASADEERRPVTVIDRTNSMMSGLTSVSELLGSQTVYNSFGLRRPYFGIGRAAFLVNGRNVSGLDLSTLPISAVERVEILDEGPTRHGVDALTGAINIVLRNDYEGTEVSAGAGLPTQEGRDSQHGNALWGGALGRGQVTIGVAHIGREEVRDKDRDFSKARWTPGGSIIDTTGVSISGNTLIAVPEGAVPPRAKALSLGPCDPSVYTGVLTHPAGEVCGYPYAQIAWIDGYEQFTRESLFLAAEHPLGDDSDVYVEARVAQGDSLSVYAPPVGTFDFVATGSVMQNLIDNAEGLDSSNFPADGEVTVRHRFVGHGNREWREDVKEYELTLGVQGGLDDGLGYNMRVEHYRHKTVETGINLVSERLARAAIESGAYDIANPLSPADPRQPPAGDPRYRTAADPRHRGLSTRRPAPRWRARRSRCRAAKSAGRSVSRPRIRSGGAFTTTGILRTASTKSPTCSAAAERRLPASAAVCRRWRRRPFPCLPTGT